jgi:plasmid segregation protein ParM
VIIGVDVGNYSTKTSEDILFLSKVTSDKTLFEQATEIEYNSKTYIIGQGEFETDLDKSSKEHLMVYLLTAIAKSTKDIANQVVIGLPILHFKSNKDKLKNIIMNNRINTILLNGLRRQIVITDCEVFPEGVGAFYSLQDEEKDMMSGKDLIIIDIGGRTTDICLLSYENDMRIISKPLTLFIGMINIYDDFIKAINEKLTLNKELEDAEKILRNGLELFGVKQDLSFTKPVIKKYIDKIVKELYINYPIQTENVIVTGGGSFLLGEALRAYIPNLTMMENSIFANAYGFKRVGESLWLKN